jgi:hypothetical protein
MEAILSKFEPGELIGLVAVSGGLLVGLLCGLSGIIMGIWHNARQTEITASLKRDMLNRGMSAEEIRVVIEAGTHSSHKGSHKHPLCNE